MLPTRPALGVVFLLAVVLFINYVDRGALPTAAHLVQDDLHLTAPQLGTLFSAFFYTYTLMQIPMGWLAERYGAHRVLAWGLTLWAVATMCVGFANSFTVLLGLRLLLGIGESVGFPCVAKLVAAVVPVKNLGLANGMVACGYLFGPAVGTYAGGMLMASYGWRTAFMLFGGLSLLWLLPWLRVKLPPRALAGSDDGYPNLAVVLRQPALWGTAFGLFSSNYVFYFILNWMPFYLVRERGFSTVEMAQLTGAAFVINALSAMASGWMTDRLIVKGWSANTVYKWNMAIAHVGFVICMMCMAWGSRMVAMSAMFFYQFLCGAQSPGIYAIPQILAGPRATGRWVGISNSVGSFAGVVAPQLTGLILGAGATPHFTMAFLVAAVFGLLGLVAWLAMIPRLGAIDWQAVSGTTAGAAGPAAEPQSS